MYGSRISDDQLRYIHRLTERDSYTQEFSIKCSVLRTIIHDMLDDIRSYQQEIYELQRDLRKDTLDKTDASI